MPGFLDPKDTRLLIGAIGVMVLLFVLTIALQPAPAQQSLGYPSSYSTDWSGAKAAFLLLQSLGFREERWEASPQELPENSENVTFVLAEPTQQANASDRAAILRFVSGGGRLLVTGASGASFAPGAAAEEVDSSDLEPVTYLPLIPSPLTRGAPEITMIAPDQWTSTRQVELGVYGDENNPVVVSYHFGQGQVIWWASSSPLSNGSIREKGNSALFLNSIGSPNSRVLWDEYFHGARGSLGAFFAKTPLPWAGLQVAIALIALLFTFSRRSGPVCMPASDSRLSPVEFVETLGDLYLNAHAAPAAVGVAYQRFLSSLLRKLGLPAKTKLSELSHAAAGQFNWSEAALLDTLSRSERAKRGINVDESVALDLVRQLHGYTADLELVRKSLSGRSEWK